MEKENVISNKIDVDYQNLLKDILDNGVQKKDRTGTGTISLFGRQIRHRMSEGFPLITTKKMHWKSIVIELLWFLRGDTNIKYLVENGCHIWNGDALKNFNKHIDEENVKMSSDPLLMYQPKARWGVSEFIERIKTDSEFANKWGNLGPIYGKQWRAWDRCIYDPYQRENNATFRVEEVQTIDQIADAIHKLKTNPDDRGIIVSAWNVGELDQMVLRPCHNFFQFYTRELSLEERTNLCTSNITTSNILEVSENCKSIGFDEDDFLHQQLDLFNVPRRAISLMWNQRSVDTFLGLPFNIASYALLLEIIAKEVNMIPDELIGNLGDVHLYSNHIEQAKEQIGRAPMELPKLNFNTEWWDKPFFEAVKSDAFCKCLLEENIQLSNYQSHPAIKAPLSN
jgi:thymidylate synthase